MDRKIAGFSILEVLIVIAILSILTAVIVTTYTKYKADRELMRQANQLLDEISWIKSQSIAKEPHGIRITLSNYTLFKDIDGNCDYNIGEEIRDETVKIVDFESGITSTTTQTIVFDRKGYARAANCALGTLEGTITLKNTNNNTKNIKISQYGRTRIE